MSCQLTHLATAAGDASGSLAVSKMMLMLSDRNSLSPFLRCSTCQNKIVKVQKEMMKKFKNKAKQNNETTHYIFTGPQSNEKSRVD